MNNLYPSESRFRQSRQSANFRFAVECFKNKSIHPTAEQYQSQDYQNGLAYEDGRDRGRKPDRKQSPDILYGPQEQYAFERGLEHGRAEVETQRRYLLLQYRSQTCPVSPISIGRSRGSAESLAASG